MGNSSDKLKASNRNDSQRETRSRIPNNTGVISNAEAWQFLIASNVSGIRKWLSQQKDVTKALTTEVYNQQTAMQLIVGGRSTPTSAEIIEALKVLIEHGADINYIPPKGTGSRLLLTDPVPYLAAIHCEPAVLQFLFEHGADFTVAHPDMPRTALNQCSFINALTLQQLLDPAAIPQHLSFEQTNYPAQYNHDLTVKKLGWVHFISDSQLKSRLSTMLQSRVVKSYEVGPNTPFNQYTANKRTEVTFELQLNSMNNTMTPVTLSYWGDVSGNGSETCEMVLSMPRDQHRNDLVSVKLTHYLNAFIGNDLIPDQRAEHYEEFEQSLSSAMQTQITADVFYLFALMLLCHVDDDMLVRKQGWHSSRSSLLKPSILGAMSVPPVVAQLNRDWARV